MKKYRVIVPTSLLCFDEFITAENKKAAANELITKIKNNYRYIIVYGACVEEV